MNEQFRQFSALGIDLSPLGVEPRDPLPYFCTPRGAEVFGWTGVDGSHFCFVPGFGETVFSVTPMLPPYYVHPVARDFRDFLRLLLACGHAITVEQAMECDEAAFYAKIQEDEPWEEQELALEELAARTGLTPMEQPWAYMRALMDAFDPASIPYTEEFYELTADEELPPSEPWEVHYGSFWSRAGSAGAELAIGLQFDWAGRSWRIPLVYLCEEGIAIDFCMKADAEALRAFLDRWADRGEAVSREKAEQIALENPLQMDFSPEIEVNGTRLSPDHGYAVPYWPEPPAGEANDAAALRAAAHYRLDPTSGWLISRSIFPGRLQSLDTLAVHMTQNPVDLPGPHFQLRAPGDRFSFAWQGRDYTITATQIEQQELPQPAERAGMRRPAHFTILHYQITPEAKVTICDCAESDASVLTEESSAIGVIGGADGPSVLILNPRSANGTHAVCSALHFEPAAEIEWRLRLPQEPCPDAWFSLL